MTKKCKTCGKELTDPDLTHCSDKCLFETTKNSKPFDPKSK